MKLIYVSLFFCTIIFCACNNKATSILRTSNLESSFILVDADSAYTLKTGKGSVIKIAAGTFVTKNDSKVTIEIKEAFTMQDMLLAGLSTQSNGRALQSGGMIYFNASSDGKQLDINKPIDISMPSEIYDPNMQLFKGEINADSTVNWVAPVALDTTPNAQMILNGEAIFKANCASCHKIFNDFTGPSLAGFASRAPSKQWLYDFIKNPAEMVATDPYAHVLQEKWKPTIMTSFPLLSKQAIDGIIAYVENESKLNPATYNEYAGAADTSKQPCGYDTIIHKMPEENNEIAIISNELNDTIPDNNNLERDERPNSIDADGVIIEKNFAIRDGIYNFKIEQNGWYNIDVFVNENLISINASVNLSTEAAMNAYLFFPEKKSLFYGGLSKSNTILFLDGDNNNKVRAPIGAEAILLVFGSDKNDMYYAVERFTIKASQDIMLQPKKTTEAGLLDLIKKNNIDGFKIDIYKNDWEVVEKPCDDIAPEKNRRTPMPGA